MSHYCQALVLACIDFRFITGLANWLKNQNLEKDYDLITIAGSAKNLASPQNENEKEFILKQIEISNRLHQIKKVILVNHQDCGAYGGSAAFGSLKEEFEFHQEELMRGKEKILEGFPNLTIQLVYARIDQSADKPVFEVIE